MAMRDVERRQSFRIKLKVSVRYRMIDETTQEQLTDWTEGTIGDISLGGVKLIASMPESQIDILVNQYGIVAFSFQLPGTSEAISATATIVYFLRGSTIKDATTVTLGLSFLTIDSSARDIIGEYINRHIDSPE